MNKRMAEFIHYHKFGDGECNNVVLKEYADSLKMNAQERYDFAFLFAVTYCVPSACVLFDEYESPGRIPADRLAYFKDRLIFQSDRKYMRMKDNFERCYADFVNNHSSVFQFLKNNYDGSHISLQKAIKEVSGWVMFGRFSAFLFLETLVCLLGIPFDNASIDWKHGDTATSGLLNLIGNDAQADYFDKTGKLIVSEQFLDSALETVKEMARKSNASDNVTELETSLCAYRKFFKGSRYNGYYLDRMLAELNQMKAEYPELANKLFEIRKRKFDAKYLGEISGWSGIRTELKKSYIETGVVI